MIAFTGMAKVRQWASDERACGEKREEDTEYRETRIRNTDEYLFVTPLMSLCHPLSCLGKGGIVFVDSFLWNRNSIHI